MQAAHLPIQRVVSGSNPAPSQISVKKYFLNSQSVSDPVRMFRLGHVG